MPRREQALDPNGGPIVEFAMAMRAVKERSGLPYREMAERASYSHVALQRAANGKKRPGWPLASAFLDACDASDEEKRRIKRLWNGISNPVAGTKASPPQVQRRQTPAPLYTAISGDTVPDMLALADASTAFSTSEKHLRPIGVSVERDAIRAGSLRSICTRVAFGDALRRFTELEGFATHRALADFIGRGFTEVGALFNGVPTADPMIVDLIFEKLGFELEPEADPEVKEFIDARKRIERNEITWYQGLRGRDRTIVTAISKSGGTISEIAAVLGFPEKQLRDHVAELHRICGTGHNFTLLAQHLELIWVRSRPSASMRGSRSMAR